MERTPAGEPVEGGLVVSLDGTVVRHLAPGGDRLTFGRAELDGDHLHIGPTGDRADCAVSRIAGSIRWQGQWTVRNESSGRPFLLVAVPQRILRAPRSGPWPIGPKGVDVELTTPTRTYTVGMRPLSSSTSDPPFPLLSGDSTAPALGVPTPHERLLLAAKFLGRRTPGHAIGDVLAAERINAVRPPWAGRVSAKAVENVVRRWRDKLEWAGVRDIAGRKNIDQLGSYLLAYGVVTPEDRLDLPPVEDGE